MQRISVRGLLIAQASLLSALLPLPAAAQLHQICYRDITIPNEPVAVSADCRSENPGVSCKIVPPPGFVVLSSSGTPTSRTASFRAPNAAATYSLTFRFSGGAVRTCTVEMGAPAAPAFVAQGRLVGYTTDDSGLLMTGVWATAETIPQGGIGALATVSVPADFLVTGGGAVGAEFPSGALLADLQRDGFVSWEGGTIELLSADAYVHQSFAIGMKIEGLAHDALVAASSVTSARSIPDRISRVVAPTPPGVVVLGGGAVVHPGPPWQQFLTESAPVLGGGVITGWEATSMDHLVASIGDVKAVAYLFAPRITLGKRSYKVEVSVTAGASGPAQHPFVVVPGAPGFALTGVGAFVDWQDFGFGGNFLWELQPRPDIGGVEAASKDHTVASPAVIEGLVIGARLVP